MRRFITLTLVLLTAIGTSQTQYYVNGVSGNNSNNGQSPTNAWKTIQKACNSASPNSIVRIMAGTYHENVVVNVSGTPGNPIVFTNYQNGTVILDGAGTIGSVMLVINNKKYLTFENLTIQNLYADYAKAVNIEAGTGSCTGITLRNLTINNIGWTQDNQAIASVADNAWGIKVKGQNGGITDLTIEDCHIFNNVLGYSEALILAGNIDGFLIRNCQIHDNTNIGIDIIGHNGSSTDPVLDIPRNGVITGNTCFRNVSPIAQSAGIYIDGAHNITIERNNCYENPIGIEVGCEEDGVAQYIKVKNNLIYNNFYTGLAVGGYTTETTGQVLYSTFRNNTLFKNNSLNAGIGEITVSKASNCVFEDNIVYSGSQNILLTMLEIEPQQNNIVNYNCWYTPAGNPNNITIYWKDQTYSSIAAYETYTGQDSNSIYANPLLGSILLPFPELSLLVSSLCINHGNPELLIPEGETDFDGNPRIVGNTIDIGAREFNPALALGIIQAPKSTVAPNPFSVRATVYFPEELSSASLLLYDFSGRLVRAERGLSGNEIMIERENLRSGLYLYKVISHNRVIASGKLSVE